MYKPDTIILSSLGFEIDGTFDKHVPGNTWVLKFGQHNWHTHTHELCYNAHFYENDGQAFWLLHCSVDSNGEYDSNDFFTFDALPQPQSDEQLKALVFAFTGK